MAESYRKAQFLSHQANTIAAPGVQSDLSQQESYLWDLSEMDNSLITKGLEDLFSVLSVYSPSDSQHGFKYLTFEPDTVSETQDEHRLVERPMLSKPCSGAGGPSATRTFEAICKVFGEIMSNSPFDNDEQERRWWQQLPLVPIVTRVLLRQQTRRRWRPYTLTQMFTRMPRLQEVHYEPWKEWLHPDIQQRWTDEVLQTLLEAPFLARLRKLVLFENFNTVYPASFGIFNSDPRRITSASMGRALVKASLDLDSLSASFLVDAVDFFEETRGRCLKWPNLRSLALTSELLRPAKNPTKLDDMLRAVAATALNMPNLETMELWNGLEEKAMLVRYRRARLRRPATIEWKGTWEMTLRDPIIEAWDAVALRHSNRACVTIGELVVTATPIRSHGDAIRLLGLSEMVIRPVSLRQILREDTIREEMQDD
ncbi:hypothetical protein EG328_006177 [Venturia inaequalis]|uniref:DUF6546 domain-containing protein n=1 Tax=Venturia inaequalis TaxID=5025 RepID=A0A8H3UJY8_VENIN|nr:hypothetical protein EG328_006177 [Venturia inaequalis]